MQVQNHKGRIENLSEFVLELQARGVVLEVSDGKLRCRGSLTPEERKMVGENAPIIAALLNPDLTLPDDLHIPASVPNNVVAIADHVNKQRREVTQHDIKQR